MRRARLLRRLARLLLPSGAALLLGAAACGGGDGEDVGATVLPPGMTPPPQGNNERTPPAVPFSGATARYAARAVRSWPHDPNAYTQGLLVHGGTLYEGTGQWGESDVRQVELETGRVLRQAELTKDYFGEGIAVLRDRLYQLTWTNGVAFVRDPRTLAIVDSARYTGEGWGLATDDSLLYLSDGTSRLRVIEPTGFRVVRTIDVTEAGRPIHFLNELEWVKGELWANVWQTEWVARIDPRTGQVVGWIGLHGLLTEAEAAEAAQRTGITHNANGIAYDAARDRLLVTGKHWPKLVQIAVERQ